MKARSFFKTTFTKFLIVLVLALQITACSSGGSSNELGNLANGILLSWTAPTERENGAGISLSEIAGYRVYYGNSSGIYPNQLNIEDSAAVRTVLSNLVSATYYIVVTTIDTEGRESTFSDEIVRTW